MNMTFKPWHSFSRLVEQPSISGALIVLVKHLHFQESMYLEPTHPPRNPGGMPPRQLGPQVCIPEAATAGPSQRLPRFLSPGAGGLFGWDPWAIPCCYPNGHRVCLGHSAGQASLKVSPERKCERAEVLDKGNFWAGFVQKFPVKCFTSRLGKD